MMDPLSVTSSIATILQLAGNVMKFISDVKDASTACNRILAETGSIYDILSNIKGLVDEAESDEVWLATVRSLGAPNGPLAQFELALEQVATRIEPIVGSRKAGRAFVWPFKKDEVMDILYTLERQKTLFMLALQNDHMELSRAIRNEFASVQRGVNQISNTVTQLQLDQKNQEDRTVVEWLSPLNFWAKQNDIFSRRQEGTGKWLLEAELFKAWLDGTEKILWCPGIPGAGKTVLASIIINYLEQSFNENAAVACMYCNYKEQNQTAINLVASLLQQLVQRQSVVSDDIIAIYRGHSRKQTRPSLAEYLELLQSEVHRFSKVFIVIDALDECSEKEGIRGFIPEVRKLPPNTHLLVTSRYITAIEHEFEKVARLEIRASDEDVKSYVKARIEEQSQLVRHTRADPALRSAILDTIVQKADGMFLLAQLHMDSLAQEDSRRGVRRALQNLPNELNRTYDEVIKRIKGQDCRKVKRAEQVLSWISYGLRQLTVKEIQYALAVDPDDTDLDEEALPDEVLMVSACAGLITIDQQSNIVRLVHYTAQEYLKRTCIDLFPNAKARIAGTCLTYLSFDAFADGYCLSDEETETRLQKNPLLHYAAHYWGHHVREGTEQNQTIQKSVLNFLEQERKVSCAIQVQYIVQCRFEGYTLQFPRDVSSLQVAASFGLKEIVKMLIENGADTMAKDSNGTTSLHSAASNGYEEVVEILLGNGADVEAKDNNGMTALHLSASNGREAVVQALLERSADISAKSDLGETALHRAAWNGQAAVVRQLLERGVELDPKDTEFGDTPLSRAAWLGHEAVVRLLLEHGADPNLKETEYGQTPLGLTAECGQDKVARLLLSQESIKPDSKDRYGRTPLWWAARKGHVMVARPLLERNDVDPYSMDMWGKTPLFRAVEYGHEAVVQLLTHFISGHPVNHSFPPILQAAKDGDEPVVRLLLERDGVNLDIKSSNGQTPLSLAARNGHDAIVLLLLERDGVDLESRCMSGRTPLSWAAGNGHKIVVQLLLKKGVDPNSKSNSGRSPLWLAAIKGHEEVVRLLLEQDGIDVDSRCLEYNSTPLCEAVEYGHEVVVRLLLEKGADIKAKDIEGRTVLRVAAFKRHEMIMLLLKSKTQSS